MELQNFIILLMAYARNHLIALALAFIEVVGFTAEVKAEVALVLLQTSTLGLSRMSGLELNKVAAGVLVAGLIAMVSGKVADGLYHPVHEVEKRGFAVEVAEEATASSAAQADKPENILPLLASADVAAGEAITKKCTSCHTFENGGANKVGPNLYGIIGSDIAHKSDYSYSDAMAGKEGAWDYNAISSFLKKPKDYIPGTKMAFAGLSKEEDRANLIAYLRTLSASPKALPTAAEIASAAPKEEAVPTPAASATGSTPSEEIGKSKEIAEEKADKAIQKDAGETTPPGKTPDAEQAKELEANVDAGNE